MSINLYDKALLNKLKSWINDDSLTITSPDETRRLFAYKLDTQNDEPIKLPLICLRRNPSIDILQLNKKPLSFDGLMTEAQRSSNKSNELNAIPIQINYQLDIYTRYEEEALEYVREFVFKLINEPKLSVEIPYNNAKKIHNSNIRLSQEIQNNSDIPERLIPGEFSRYTLSMYIDDGYLWNYKTKELKNIEINDVTVTLKDDIKDK